MSTLNLIQEINKAADRIQTPEHMLGKGAVMPFNSANSGSRKLMFGIHLEQRLPLINAEVPQIQTGYEDEFGRYSSSFKVLDEDQHVVGHISKHSKNPFHHYFIILHNDTTDELSVVERCSYKHISESYGYLYNNENIDIFIDSARIPAGTVIQKSTSFDEDNSRMDGVNLITGYMALEHTMEDGIILSKSGANKLASPLIRVVEIQLNDNDIPLNLYGDNDTYKVIPDIGEHIKNGVLCGIRREKKEECLYSQSWDRLKTLMMSDDKRTLIGEVIDIDVHVNNPEKMAESQYYRQINEYYQEYLRQCREVIDMVGPLLEKGCTMSYDLQKLYYTSLDVLNGKKYISDRAFTGTIMKVTVLEKNEIRVGDKLSNRYGGKGVVAGILSDELMPQCDNGKTMELIFNNATCVNRLNAGQLFETEINFVGRRIIEHLRSDCIDIGECISMYLRFLEIISPKEYAYFDDLLNRMDDESKIAFITSMCNDGGIWLSIEPMSESCDIDKLAKLYEEFFVPLDRIKVPIKGSNGSIRYVEARRPIIAASEYIYRLKQYAEEKFSVTSLSSTNLRNENSRNKMNNNYKALYPKTPIRFGEMESGNFIHLGAELVIENLMLYSASPHGRRLVESMMTGNPFDIDIRLDDRSTNRNVEILNTYLKTCGLRIVFRKVLKKKKYALLIQPMIFGENPPMVCPMHFYHPEEKMPSTEPFLPDDYVEPFFMVNPLIYPEDEVIDEDELLKSYE